jgi:cbb3-type cytochrome oxidase subunit 3
MLKRIGIIVFLLFFILISYSAHAKKDSFSYGKLIAGD